VPTIAVHIVTYNSASAITGCLTALAAQQHGDYGVTVIDNASADDTVALVQQHGFAPIVNPRNVGYAAGQNQALRLTDSRYVLTLNPDVALEPGFLTAMQSALDTAPGCGSAAGCLLRVDALDEQPLMIDGTGLFMRRNRRQGLLNEGVPAAQCPLARQPIFGPDGAAAFYRRAMLDDVQIDGEVFDADFFMHKEDIDVVWRAQLLGWRSMYVPDAVAKHIRTFRPGQRARVNDTLRATALRNRYLLMLKNDMPALFWRDLLRIALYDVALVGYVVLRERRSLRAFFPPRDVLRRMLHKRRQIQARRRVTSADMRQWFR
jgi:GT2 family glycosyltransferase